MFKCVNVCNQKYIFGVNNYQIIIVGYDCFVDSRYVLREKQLDFVL